MSNSNFILYYFAGLRNHFAFIFGLFVVDLFEAVNQTLFWFVGNLSYIGKQVQKGGLALTGAAKYQNPVLRLDLIVSVCKYILQDRS